MEQPRPEQQQEPRYKTLGVRLEEGLHSQLSFVAQLTDSTLAEEIRRAIEARVVAAQEDPDLIARAQATRAEIEREAQARQQAIAGFFGSVAVEATTGSTDKPAARGRGSSATK